jgi:DNA-binding response OmpR family regulator
MRALVVEDEPAIAEVVAFALRRDGMPAEVAGTLAAGRELAAGTDLVVVDLGLPDGSGYDLVTELARLPRAPRVIVLSSRDEEVEGVAALEAGADDFVRKPFSPRALVARARAVLRRGARAPAAPSGDALHVDLSRREASYAGVRLALTRTELDLLAALASAPGRVFSRGQLVERVWGGHALTERTVDSHVKLLRRKLGEAGAPELVLAVRGVGFKLSDEP